MPKTEAEPEDVRWEIEQNRRMAERAHDTETDFFNRANEFTITAGNHAMRGFLLINGGAAVALLAFLGTLLTSEPRLVAGHLATLTNPLMWFVWGVVLATGGFGAAFFANRGMVEASSAKKKTYEYPYIRKTEKSTRYHRITNGIQVIAVLLALGSLTCFVWGMVDIKNAISTLTLANP